MIFRITNNLVLTVSLLALGACAPQGPNQWVPKGYTYQDNSPISSPAPSSPWLKEAEIRDTEKLASSTAAWQGAVFELIDGLGSAIPSDGSPINVKAKAPVTNQDLALDHYVRQAIMQKKMTLTTTDAIGLALTVDSEPLTQKDALEKAKTVENFEYVDSMELKGAFLLTAILTNADGSVAGESKTVAVLPYEKTEYARLPGYTTLPTVGLSTDKSAKYNP